MSCLIEQSAILSPHRRTEGTATGWATGHQFWPGWATRSLIAAQDDGRAAKATKANNCRLVPVERLAKSYCPQPIALAAATANTPTPPHASEIPLGDVP